MVVEASALVQRSDCDTLTSSIFEKPAAEGYVDVGFEYRLYSRRITGPESHNNFL